MFYQKTKSMQAAVIGSIMPWSGPLSEIPDGWLICDGSEKNARDYPLLVQAIGDTYNPVASNLGGAFPLYNNGKFYLPNLINGSTLMDIETSYFGPSGSKSNNPIDSEADAANLIVPYIGDNRDNTVQSVFTDVYTDIIFTLNDRTGYQGTITGNDVIDGQAERTVFIGGRKLGHTHILQHTHSGAYETINNNPSTKPGDGVIPWDNVEMAWKYRTYDVSTGGGDGLMDDMEVAWMISYQEVILNYEQSTWDEIEITKGITGFGNGIPGRTVAGINSEQPPVNIYPRDVGATPIANQGEYNQRRLESDLTINYARRGTTVNIPTGLKNYYSEYDPAIVNPSPGYFGTLLSNPGDLWVDSSITAHDHDSFDVVYDQSNLKPQSRLIATVNIPSTTLLDNTSNAGALQIDMNTSQPSLTCIYIIRAY